MIIYKTNHWKKQEKLWVRTIDILPSLSINFYPNYTFESVRFSWLGFMIGIGC